MGKWLYDWRTLVGAVFASLVAIISAGIAWAAAMKQIAVTNSERERRAKYAAALARSHLSGVSVILGKIERASERLAAVSEDAWMLKHPDEILLGAQAAFDEPTGNPQSSGQSFG